MSVVSVVSVLHIWSTIQSSWQGSSLWRAGRVVRFHQSSQRVVLVAIGDATSASVIC